MSGGDRVLLSLCAPWLVAFPIAQVLRVLTGDESVLRPHGAGGALLGTLEDGGGVRAAWDLRRLLGLDGGAGPGAGSTQAWVLLNLPVPLALRTGACLSVLPAPPTAAIPAVLARQALGLRLFVRPALPLPAALQDGLGPAGLALDVPRLFSATDLARARHAIQLATPVPAGGR
jgi:hypothetical protein